jgi:hypothetical protein
MTILVAIWNGPFHVGKLAQPVSVGDVLLKILEVLWRAIISIIVLGVSVAGYVYYVHPVLYPPAKDSISAKALYAANLPEPPPVVRTGASFPSSDEIERKPCAKDFPVRISVFNNGSKPVTDIRFELEGYIEGYSDNYVEYDVRNLTSDRILPPQRGFSGCYRVRTKDGIQPETLTYKVNIWSASEAKQ